MSPRVLGRACCFSLWRHGGTVWRTMAPFSLSPLLVRALFPPFFPLENSASRSLCLISYRTKKKKKKIAGKEVVFTVSRFLSNRGGRNDKRRRRRTRLLLLAKKDAPRSCGGSRHQLRCPSGCRRRFYRWWWCCCCSHPAAGRRHQKRSLDRGGRRRPQTLY